MKFKICGIRFFVSFLFVCMIAFMIAIDRTGLILPLMAAMLLHEMAHLAVMCLLKRAPLSVSLILGGIKITRDLKVNTGHETLISLSGPLINLAVFLIFFIDYLFCKSITVLQIALLNAVVAAFNLLPVLGLDGGAVLSNVISQKTGDVYKGERVVRIISLFMGALFFFLGSYFLISGSGNLSFFTVSLYLIVSALIKY